MASVKWDFALYYYTNEPGRRIDVHEAIKLRDVYVKPGDFHCCTCKKERLTPVNSKSKVKHFRSHPAQSDEKREKKKKCKRVNLPMSPYGWPNALL